MQAAVAAHQSVFSDEPLPCCQLSTSSSSLSAPSSQHHPVLPVISTHYTPSVLLATNQAPPLRDQLLAFVTSGKEKRIGFTPDARHLIVDTGAIITITNAVTDFDHSPQPVKLTQSKVLPQVCKYSAWDRQPTVLLQILLKWSPSPCKMFLCSRLSHPLDLPVACC
jgi:hypothetical protein